MFSLAFRKLICQTENQHESFSETQLSNSEPEGNIRPHFFISVVKSETAAGECGAARPIQTRDASCRSDGRSGTDTTAGRRASGVTQDHEVRRFVCVADKLLTPRVVHKWIQ